MTASSRVRFRGKPDIEPPMSHMGGPADIATPTANVRCSPESPLAGLRAYVLVSNLRPLLAIMMQRRSRGEVVNPPQL